jgi:hypothetical protein
MKKAVFAITCLASIGVSFAATEVLTVSHDGVGSIRANTPFNQKKVAALLNEFKVVSAKGMTEGEEYPILKVFDQKGEIAVINPSEDRRKIFSIVVVSDRVKNVLGPKIGDSYNKIYGTSVHKSCSAGTEEMSGRVICQDPKSGRVQYVFKGVYDGPDGEVPAFEILKNWKIAQIVWKP